MLLNLCEKIYSLTICRHFSLSWSDTFREKKGKLDVSGAGFSDLIKSGCMGFIFTSAAGFVEICISCKMKKND